jgi:hypothetical protein
MMGTKIQKNWILGARHAVLFFQPKRLSLTTFTLKITLIFVQFQDGLHQNAQRFLPNFVLSFTALSLFCLGCSFVLKHKRRSRIDWIRSKPYIACAGLLNTLMSLISGFGLMMILGMPYNVINSIIPFVLIGM